MGEGVVVGFVDFFRMNWEGGGVWEDDVIFLVEMSMIGFEDVEVYFFILFSWIFFGFSGLFRF